MAAAGIYLRVLYLGWPMGCDQLPVSRAALDLALSGRDPWGIGYSASNPPGSPFPYGPLAMATSVLGVPGEIVAVSLLMLVLAWQRAILTLAVLSGWYIAVEYGVCGLNDQLPALLLLVGLLAAERRRWVLGAGLVAISAAIKPYTFAWFPGLIGIGGMTALLTLGTVTLVAWLPVLLFGPGSFLRSIELARATHPTPENTLNLPALRIVALPIAIAACFVRSWTLAVLSGALIFLVVLFLDSWASVGYWYVVVPPVGIVAERALDRIGARLRAAHQRRLAQDADTGDADRVPVGALGSEGT
jgi:hypothetical protein